MHLTGSADVPGADVLRRELLAVVAERPRLIVLDLAEVSFAGSAALGAIVLAYVRCRASNTEIRLVGLRRRVHRALEVTRLTMLFKEFDSVEAALEG